jgi:hypothetical protein
MADCTPITQIVVDGDGTTSNFPIPPPSLTPIDVNASSVFPLTLQAATAGTLTRVYRIYLTVSGPCTLVFDDGGTALPGKIEMQGAGNVTLDQGLFPWWQGSVDTDFKLNLIAPGSVTVEGAVWINLNPT